MLLFYTKEKKERFYLLKKIEKWKKNIKVIA